MGLSPINRIHLLPASVANQIAAGEVIERPASVVKELLENALDAGANVIHIEIGFGGLNQVKISDNGAGILEEDLPLAIAAHATSKISQLNDLYAINSMGFRGEALASIASVSRLSLYSKPLNQSHAMMLRMDGETVTLSPCARNQGTTIDVRDIFFNAPVRKKFLKTERSEYQAIDAVVKRFALCAPEVALTLTHNDKQMLALPASRCMQTRLLRIQKLLGKTFIDQAVYLDVERAGMRLEGWVSGPDYQRSQNDKQWIYINRRMVKDKLMNHAMKQAYEGRLYPGRHPACVLYLTIPTDQVDVNVHPTKHEVRFQQPRLVHDFMTSQIVQALATTEEKPLPIQSHHCENTSSPDPSTPWEFESQLSDNRIGRVKERNVESLAYSTSTPSWLTLNTHFAMVHLQDEPWLINIQILQQLRLTALLQQQDLPLPWRPLLVPISCTIDKANYALIERVIPLLIQVGIQCDFISDSRLRVHTIPQLLVSLDIQQFIRALNSDVLTVQDILPILVACQTLDARQLTQHEKIELTDYMRATPDVLIKSGLQMDVATCRSLLHG